MFNLAGIRSEISDALLQVELSKAGVVTVSGPIGRGEVQTHIRGILEFTNGRAEFHRLWYYWSVSIAPGLPAAAAKELNKRLGEEVRVDGCAGGKKVDRDVTCYHVDTQAGLNELVKCIGTAFSVVSWQQGIIKQSGLPDLVGKARDRQEMKAVAALAREHRDIKRQLNLFSTAANIGVTALGDDDGDVQSILYDYNDAIKAHTRLLLERLEHQHDNEDLMWAHMEIESRDRQRASILRKLKRFQEAESLERAAARRRPEVIRFVLANRDALTACLTNTPDDSHNQKRLAFTHVMLSRLWGREKDFEQARASAELARAMTAQLSDHYQKDLRSWLQLWR